MGLAALCRTPAKLEIPLDLRPLILNNPFSSQGPNPTTSIKHLHHHHLKEHKLVLYRAVSHLHFGSEKVYSINKGYFLESKPFDILLATYNRKLFTNGATGTQVTRMLLEAQL